jgi:hypothetical protein
MRAEKQIQDERMEALLWTSENRTDAASLSYEEGVDAALSWVLGESDFKPIETPYELTHPD